MVRLVLGSTWLSIYTGGTEGQPSKVVFEQFCPRHRTVVFTCSTHATANAAPINNKGNSSLYLTSQMAYFFSASGAAIVSRERSCDPPPTHFMPNCGRISDYLIFAVTKMAKTCRSALPASQKQQAGRGWRHFQVLSSLAPIFFAIWRQSTGLCHQIAMMVGKGGATYCDKHWAW